MECELRRTVGGVAVNAEEAGAGRDHHDFSAPALRHSGVDGAHRMDGAGKIRVHLPLERGAAKLFEPAGLDDAG
ncbi:hypothetical protein D3C87_2149530 [compost metagenome]